VGGWLARHLHDRGEEVRGVYRREAPPRRLVQLGAEGVELGRLDLSRPQDAAEAVRGVHAVVHAAALTGDWGSPSFFMAGNYDLTVSMARAAQEAGCAVFLYIGSVAVQGFGPHVDSTEEGPYYPHVHPYQITKKMAEDHVLSLNRFGFRTTVIRPGNAYGPHDTTMLYRLLDGQRLGVRGTLGGGHSLTCPVYVEDVAEAVRLALHCEASAGEAINVTGGERVTWREFLGYAAELTGRRPFIGLPIPVARAIAPPLVAGFELLRIPVAPPVTRYRVEQLAHDFHFDIGKARRLLRYSPQVQWREGLRRAVAAYRDGD
jgi:nucleoside-diphosphate-sugar epimerase